ncbi:DUF899 domain-containing protein [Granulicella sp. 5B5]|uniref:DUF899 domain-containing protein n=1 Tax=Granulicella sp. 5B5 TaxID=1617967 RepID=UPI0015F736FB|nr:thioredoxin family protein [Granulicella sp. 5B5]QMV17897.1 DUF899 domain-containing protein [Granulicella sp. 5B5]
MTVHSVVSRQEWMEARVALLAKEKELTRQRDALARERLQLPWECIRAAYVFDTPDGKETLPGLFEGKSQLLVYHFMFGPEWEQGCPSCSMAADTMDANYVHLTQRDVSFVMVSRAPMDKIAAFKKRMGWTVPWVSSYGSEFNDDFGVSFRSDELQGDAYNFGTSAVHADEMPGMSAFYKDERGTVYHTYSGYARSLEGLLGVYAMLDVAPLGRNEEGMVPHPMAWVRHHDRYESAKPAHACCAH